MTVFFLILLLLSLVCLVAAAFGVTTTRVNLLALGLALYVAVPFVQTLQKL